MDIEEMKIPVSRKPKSPITIGGKVIFFICSGNGTQRHAMFSAWNLFKTPKLIILAELSSPAANFNTYQPQNRPPRMQLGFFFGQPNS